MTESKLNTTDAIEFLVEAKFPKSRHLDNAIRATAVNVGSRHPRPSTKAYEYVAQAAAYREELRSKPAEELSALCEQAKLEKAQEARARLDEKAAFAGEPQARADFAHWGKAAYWTRDEATALSFDKDPRVVSRQVLITRAVGSTFAQQYSNRLDLVTRAFPDQTARPLTYIDWGKKVGINFPAELEAVAVASQHAVVAPAPRQSSEGAPKQQQQHAYTATAAQPERIKRKPGRRPSLKWSLIEPIVRHCCERMKQMGGFDSRPGATETTLISAIQNAIEQKGLKVPSRTTLRAKMTEWRV